MEWKDKYPKKSKPTYDELLDFLKPHIRGLFLSFNHEISEQFKVYNKYHRYLDNAGWVYGYGRSYNCELFTVIITNAYFDIMGVVVNDETSLQKAFEEVRKIYNKGFEEKYAAISAKRREDQILRTKKRMEREKMQMKELMSKVNPEKFNKFKWCKKVSRSNLYKLYQSEAKGIVDEILLDDIGLTFYMRCKQAKEVRESMDKGEIICHHCGMILTAGRVSPTGSVFIKSLKGNSVINCKCGYSYTYQEYRRSCNAVNMPGGRATPIFEDFIQKWPECKETKDKMMLLDQLVHECHVSVMSGLSGRSVCVNLIEGTAAQLRDLLEKLAGHIK